MGEARRRADTPPMSNGLLITAIEVVFVLFVAMGVLLARP
jgi:hypothetical protein